MLVIELEFNGRFFLNYQLLLVSLFALRLEKITKDYNIFYFDC